VLDGGTSWRVVAGDWNGDGNDTIGVWRAAEWRLRDAVAKPAGTIFTFGTKEGDRPLVGDWDGNGSTTAGIVRGQTFVLKQGNSAGAARTSVRFRG
jgi:hypothetical protein